jgi:hypothetical protein
MFRRIGRRPHRFGPAFLSIMLAILWLPCAVRQVKAQTDPFILLINRDFSHLLDAAHTDDPNVPEPATLTNYTRGSVIATQNNTPFIFLENLATDPMQDFHITLPAMTGDPSSIFHFASPPSATGPINVKTQSPSSVQVSASLASNGDELVLDFGPNGLKTNEFIAFQVKFALDSCENCGKPSFQVALFDMCDDLTTMGPPPDISIDYLGDTPPFDGSWKPDNPSHFDEGVHPPLGSTLTLDPPGTSSFFPPPTIPEPSALLLGLIALCGLSSSGLVRRDRFQSR